MKIFLKKLSPVFLITLILFGGLILPGAISAQEREDPGLGESLTDCLRRFAGTPALLAACTGYRTGQAAGTQVTEIAGNAVFSALGFVAMAILKLVSFLTFLAGVLLNNVIQFSVVDMSKNLTSGGPIDQTWGTIRDVANLGFIFILLYAGIKMILGVGSDAQRLVVNIIVVAILINFSLFFTKVVIDTANILAIFFYSAMAPEAIGEGYSWLNPGLSDTMMKPLKLQSIWQAAGTVTNDKEIIVGVMGSIVALVAAFVFFAVSLMFIIRFVVLVFVMILSPLAFITFVLPGLKSYRKQWTDALMGQAFFAPIYFLLTWIVISVINGIEGTLAAGASWSQAFSGDDSLVAPGADGGFTTSGNIELIIMFMVTIAMLIASLVIAKKYADMAGPIASNATKWATATAGGAVVGTAGWAGRRTIGKAGERIGNNEWLKEKASTSRVARLALATSRKAGSGTFDARNAGIIKRTSKITGIDLGKARGDGGFAKFKEKKTKEKKDFVESLKPSEENMNQAELAVARTKEGTPERLAAIERLDKLKGIKDDKAVEERKKTLETEKTAAIANHPEASRVKDVEAKIAELTAKKTEAENAKDDEMVATLNSELAKLEEEKKAVSESAEKAREEVAKEYDERISGIKVADSAINRRKTNYADRIEKSPWARLVGYNRSAAASIRGSMKKKSAAEEMMEEAKKKAKEEADAENKPAPAAPTEPETKT